MEKKCSKCKLVKNLSTFYKNASRKDGLTHACKECTYSLNKSAYIKNNKEYSKLYYLKNKEKCLASMKAWREANPEKVKKSRAKLNLKRKEMRAERKLARTTQAPVCP